MKVTTDACLLGAWVAAEAESQKLRVKNVLDVGAGTAVLSLMFAQKHEPAFIDAIEIDEQACRQAEENVSASPFGNRITVIHADVKTFSFPRKYDIIISNPPFYENELRSDNERKNIAHHHAGLSLKDLLSTIKSHLSPEGKFFLMLPYKRHKEIKSIFFENDLSILKIVFVKQSKRHDYFRVMLSGQLRAGSEGGTEMDEISIGDDGEQYTDEFRNLLKDYYLHL